MKKKMTTFDLEFSITYNSNDMEHVDAISGFASKIEEDIKTLHSEYGMDFTLGDILISYPKDYRPDTK